MLSNNTKNTSILMNGRRKEIGTLSASALVVGSILFAPTANAYVPKATARPAAPSREQQQIQLQLAERTRNLADQYTNRRFGTEADPVVAEPEPFVPPEEAIEELSERRGRLTGTPVSSGNVQTNYVSSDVPVAAALVRAEPVAQNLPKLPSSGFGISAAAIALGMTGALRGRRKFDRALS
jgi:hypothetical protein